MMGDSSMWWRIPHRYNFMPLARGTAAVGYLTLLSVFQAAKMPIEEAIPKVREDLL